MIDTPSKTLVWDAPTRAFHWLLAGSFATAFITAESERLRDIHVLAGYTVFGLIAFRLVWGLLGTRYARFSSWSLSPRKAIDYLRSLFTRNPQHHTGHNPAGSWAVVAMLTLLASTAATGWLTWNEIGPGWLGDLHEGFATATLALIGVHVLAVVASSLLHRENLARAMFTGFKRGVAGVPAAGKRTAVAAALVGAVGAFWGGLIPAPGLDTRQALTAAPTATLARAAHHDDD
jgi:cytochrome b